jgi:hypothetical protein
MKVIFVAGTSHSGSTLLDLMLNAHPDLVSVGEIVNLRRQFEFKNSRKRTFSKCACGAPSIMQCEFWSAVDRILRRKLDKSLQEIDLRSPDKSGDTEIALFGAISEASGKNYIVDSSKNPSRLERLLRIPGLEVHPVHLIRDPKGHICSVKRKYGGFFKHILRYELIHERIRRSLGFTLHSVVQYEKLVVEPEETLRTILDPIGLQFHPRQLSWAEQEKHIVAGNRMRRHQESRLVLDEQWKTSLTGFQKALIDAATVFSQRKRRSA